MRGSSGHRLIAGVFSLAAIFATSMALTIVSEGPTLAASADPPTITWTGNGTTNGMRSNSENLGLTVPDGQQAWLFILTSPGTGSFELTTNLGDATGVQQGDGSVHFILFSPLNAVLTSASAVTGTDTSVLTVSGCQFGAPASSTTTTTTTTTTSTTSTTTVTSGTTPGNSGGTSDVTTSPSTSSISAGPSSATASPAVQSANGSGLAFTGANVPALLASGLLLIATGSALVLTSRRRRNRQSV